MLPPDMTVKRISQFTLQNNELNAKVLFGLNEFLDATGQPDCGGMGC